MGGQTVHIFPAGLSDAQKLEASKQANISPMTRTLCSASSSGIRREIKEGVTAAASLQATRPVDEETLNAFVQILPGPSRELINRMCTLQGPGGAVFLLGSCRFESLSYAGHGMCMAIKEHEPDRFKSCSNLKPLEV